MSIDDRDWYASGVWVAAEDESLYMARSVTAADEIVRDHNSLVAELRSLRSTVAAVEAVVDRLSVRPYVSRDVEMGVRSVCIAVAEALAGTSGGTE